MSIKLSSDNILNFVWQVIAVAKIKKVEIVIIVHAEIHILHVKIIFVSLCLAKCCNCKFSMSDLSTSRAICFAMQKTASVKICMHFYKKSKKNGPAKNKFEIQICSFTTYFKILNPRNIKVIVKAILLQIILLVKSFSCTKKSGRYFF